jgi:hypothetical protein
MLTHAFFQAIPDFAAYGLLLAWLTGSLALVKLSDSPLMSILVHAGMVFSLCFAYCTEMSQEQIVLLLAYHFLSVILITIGNKLCFVKSYRLGLFCSLFLSFVAICTMFSYYVGALPDSNFMQTIVSVGAFVVQVVGASLLSFMIYLSLCTRQDSASRTALHVLNKTLLLFIFFVALFLVPGLFCDLSLLVDERIHTLFPYLALWVSTLLSFLATSAHALASALLQRKRIAEGSRDTKLETISVSMMSIYAAFCLFVSYRIDALDGIEIFVLPGLIFVALVLMAASRLTNVKLYSILALSVLAADLFCMLFWGYAALVDYATIAFALFYLVLYGVIIVFECRALSKATQGDLRVFLKVTLLVVFELSIVSIFNAAGITSIATLFVLSIAFVLMLAFKVDIKGSAPSALWVFLRVQEFILIVVSAWYIFYRTPSENLAVLSVGLAAANMAILALLLMRIKKETRFNASWLSAPVGICFTLCAVATFEGLTAGYGSAFILSTIMMGVALFCVVIGFLLQLKPIRLYGLILVIICVVKLVTIDVGGGEPIMRTVAFIAGGMICFAMSALYNYSVKKFDAH